MFVDGRWASRNAAIARASGVARETVKKYLVRRRGGLGWPPMDRRRARTRWFGLVQVGGVVSAPRTWAFTQIVGHPARRQAVAAEVGPQQQRRSGHTREATGLGLDVHGPRAAAPTFVAASSVDLSSTALDGRWTR